MFRESILKTFMTATIGFVLFIAGCSNASVNTSAARETSDFPCPKAETDFKALFKYTAEMAKKYQKDTDDFQRLTRPYGPLDISDAPRCSEGEQRSLRNFYFGLSARAFDANPTVITRRFFCQASCWEDRKAFAVSKLDAIAKLVEKFRALSKLTVVSNWMGDGSYRFNDTFVNKDGSPTVALPSKGAGIIPSGEWQDTQKSDLQKQLKALNVSENDLQQLVAGLKENAITALKREPDGSIRAIADGFADNEWGLLFGVGKADPNVMPGPTLSGAKEVSGTAKLRAGVLFYLAGAKMKGLQL